MNMSAISMANSSSDMVKFMCLNPSSQCALNLFPGSMPALNHLDGMRMCIHV